MRAPASALLCFRAVADKSVGLVSMSADCVLGMGKERFVNGDNV
jgi:hypothetical protein